MTSPATITLVAFLMGSSLVLLISVLVSGRTSRLDARLRELSSQGGPPPAPESITRVARETLPRMGAPLAPSDEEERTKLQRRLIHAGVYGRQAMALFLGVKMLLIVGPALIGLGAGALGLLPGRQGLLIGVGLGICGVIGPSFWLDARKSSRQRTFRRALPDAFDVMVICLEGGLSLPATLRRVAEDLRTAHPELAVELNLAQREIQLGRSPGDALRQIGDRVDLEELRSLASVVLQADRFGASLVRSLRVHAETLRAKRQHRAEEMAQKAAVKLLIPTILFIFPILFVVVLGPAAIHLLRIFQSMKIPV